MPLVSEFFGIKIYMYWSEHFPPHFHAEFSGHTVLVDINSGVVIRGLFPLKQLKYVIAWCELHRDELLKNWESAMVHGEINKISPFNNRDNIMNIQVIQVYPKDDYKIYIYFSDGRVKLFDVSDLVGKGIFKKLEDREFYLNGCTVLNNTLAWDISGKYDPGNCIDIDPVTLYNESVEVRDPLEETG